MYNNRHGCARYGRNVYLASNQVVGSLGPPGMPINQRVSAYLKEDPVRQSKDCPADLRRSTTKCLYFGGPIPMELSYCRHGGMMQLLHRLGQIFQVLTNHYTEAPHNGTR